MSAQPNSAQAEGVFTPAPHPNQTGYGYNYIPARLYNFNSCLLPPAYIRLSAHVEA